MPYAIIDPTTGHSVLGGEYETETEARETIAAWLRFAERQTEMTAASDGLSDEGLSSALTQARAYYGSLAVQPVTDEQRTIDLNAEAENQARRAQQKLTLAEKRVRAARAERLDALVALRRNGVSAYRIAQVIGLSQVQVARILKPFVE